MGDCSPWLGQGLPGRLLLHRLLARPSSTELSARLRYLSPFPCTGLCRRCCWVSRYPIALHPARLSGPAATTALSPLAQNAEVRRRVVFEWMLFFPRRGLDRNEATLNLSLVEVLSDGIVAMLSA